MADNHKHSNKWADQNGLAVNPRDKETIERQVEDRKIAVRKDLESLRRGTVPYDWYEFVLGRICDAVDRKVVSLDDIGTSEKELEDLRIEGCRIVACQWLERLRKGATLRSTFIGLVRGAASRGDLSLADIGTSEKELASFL